jgi:hypothetical protein
MGFTFIICFLCFSFEKTPTSTKMEAAMHMEKYAAAFGGTSKYEVPEVQKYIISSRVFSNCQERKIGSWIIGSFRNLNMINSTSSKFI